MDNDENEEKTVPDTLCQSALILHREIIHVHFADNTHALCGHVGYLC
jgi:hypothetical protein